MNLHLIPHACVTCGVCLWLVDTIMHVHSSAIFFILQYCVGYTSCVFGAMHVSNFLILHLILILAVGHASQKRQCKSRPRQWR
jgi:hypothetical protein